MFYILKILTHVERIKKLLKEIALSKNQVVLTNGNNIYVEGHLDQIINLGLSIKLKLERKCVLVCLEEGASEHINRIMNYFRKNQRKFKGRSTFCPYMLFNSYLKTGK